MTGFQWTSIIFILAAALGGGFYPLARPELARDDSRFSLGRAFSVGVFLALSLLLMLPSGAQLSAKAFPGAPIPVGFLAAAMAFLLMLLIENHEHHDGRDTHADDGDGSVAIVMIMTAMIVAPSFLLGTALGMSSSVEALIIFFAIMAHKGSAGFALALKIARSPLSRRTQRFTYAVFAVATPLGVVAGSLVSGDFSALIAHEIRALVFSCAAGVFLYMAVMHDMQHNVLVSHCGDRRVYLLMLAGFVLTALIRAAMGMAHHIAA